MLRIAVFEKHELLRSSLAQLIPTLGPYEVVVAAADVPAFQEAVRTGGGLDIAVLSTLADEEGCCQLMHWMKRDYPIVRKLVMSLAALQAATDRMMQYEPDSILCACAGPEELCTSLRLLEQPGGKCFTHLVQQVYRERLAGVSREAPERPELTEAEERVLRAACRPGGALDKELASYLNMSLATVRTHLRHLRAKFGAHTRQELVDEARKRGYHIH